MQSSTAKKRKKMIIIIIIKDRSSKKAITIPNAIQGLELFFFLSNKSAKKLFQNIQTTSVLEKCVNNLHPSERFAILNNSF